MSRKGTVLDVTWLWTRGTPLDLAPHADTGTARLHPPEVPL
jgi:hypothetical protein